MGASPEVCYVRSVLPYLLDLPRAYDDTSEPWPVLVFLHGAAESGNDLSLVRRHGPPRLVAEGRDLPFIVVSPQSRRGGWETTALDALLDKVIAEHRVDADRVYLTGISMGGFGTWAWAAARPDRFAAIAPICGGGRPAWAERLRALPIWNFHGALDDIVSPTHSEVMVDALRAVGADVRYTVYSKAGHDSWTVTYAGDMLYEWLLGHRRAPR
jgi:predicted peptidase